MTEVGGGDIGLQESSITHTYFPEGVIVIFQSSL